MERIVFLFSSWDMRFVPAIFACGVWFAGAGGGWRGVSHQMPLDRAARASREWMKSLLSTTRGRDYGLQAAGHDGNNRHLIFSLEGQEAMLRLISVSAFGLFFRTCSPTYAFTPCCGRHVTAPSPSELLPVQHITQVLLSPPPAKERTSAPCAYQNSRIGCVVLA